MTWDNRPADIGPGHKYDSITVSPTFGLAFSVDGLDWTVYDAAMNIPPLPGHSSLPVRHVVPIFIANETIRLYFTTTTPALSSDPSVRFGCTSATAISN